MTQMNKDIEASARNDQAISWTAAFRPISSIGMDHSTRMLKVCWEEDNVEEFPYVWLKDNCYCSSCYHAVSHSRLTFIQGIDLQVEPTSAKVVEGGQQVEVVWQDGHRSIYKADWLYSHRFGEANRQTKNSHFKLEKKYWGSESLDQFPKARFQELITDDIALLEWLRHLEIYGFVMVNGAPTETGQVRRLAERIAFIRKTHYGEELTIKAKSNPSNLSYVNASLDLHGDLPYYEYQPGVQFIHCIVQSEGLGGESLVADGIHVAHQLEKECPEHYRILTETPIDWFDKGTDEIGEFHKLLRVPVLCTDSSGEICCIKLSQAQRDPYFSVSASKVSAWYTAMVAYYRLLTDPQYCLKFKMIPGTILTFDNLRIVHGRINYLSGQNERHVESCYVDWDEVRSRRRVLESKINPR